MRCLALDVGDRRTGVSVGEVLARPLATLRRRSKKQDFATIAHLILEHHVDTLVIGLPLNMDGSAGFQAQRITRYAEQLKQELDEIGVVVDMVYWDERLTTSQAHEALITSGRGQRSRRTRIDAAAAAVILQSFLDQKTVRD